MTDQTSPETETLRGSPAAWLVDSAAGKEVFLYKPNADHTAEVQRGHVIPLYAVHAQTPGHDPLAGLAERLDRLYLTSTEDGRRFVLATESAHNIVGIVREWIRSGAGAKVSISSTTQKSEGYGGWQGGDTETEKAGK